MVIGTHARIANRATKNLLSEKRRRAFVVLGSVLPDINPFTKPHRELNLEQKILKNQIKIESCKYQTIKYIRLGNMLHYLCDYFCYAHKENLEISHGAKHTAYEMALGREFKEGFTKRLQEMPIEDQEFIISNLKLVRENYKQKPGNSSRDLKYALSAVDYCVEFMTPKILVSVN